MYLVKRNPRVDWTPRYVDRFFHDFWNNSLSDLEEDSTVWSPRVDVKETKDAFELLADLPGLDKKDINISLHDDVLTVKGERKSETKSEDENSYYAERTFGSFARSFRLPRSGLQVLYSTKYFRMLSEDPPAIEPDHEVPLTAADHFAGRDPVLERALAR